MMLRCVAAATAALALGLPCKAQDTIFEGDAAGAILLDDGTVVVAGQSRVQLIPPGGRRPTLLDGSFAAASLVMRSSDAEFVVWDDSLYAAFVFDSSGDERRVVAFSKPGILTGTVAFVGLLPGDAGLFEEADPGSPFVPVVGAARDPVSYVAVREDGSRTLLWEAQGDEKVIHRTANGMTSAPVVFGYGVRAAVAGGGRFVVAQTEGDEAVIVHADGGRAGALPMPPPGEALSAEHVEMERNRLIETFSTGRMESVLGAILSQDLVREAVAGMSSARADAVRSAPANSMPPRISDLRVDRDQRVWMRRFAPPGETAALWDVRPMSGGEGFTVELPASWSVLDAAGGSVLAGVQTERGGLERVVLATIPSAY